VPFLQGALLCDSAREYNGLVSVLGGFVSIIQTPQLPITAPIWFAGRVGFATGELLEPHQIVIKADYEGRDALAQAEVRLSGPTGAPVPHPELAMGINVVLPMPFLIANEGMYFVEMTVDGQMLVRLPLKVVRRAGAG
jgi:hypothetical protein